MERLYSGVCHSDLGVMENSVGIFFLFFYPSSWGYFWGNEASCCEGSMHFLEEGLFRIQRGLEVGWFLRRGML